MNRPGGPVVFASVDWDRLSGAQRECLRSVARSTLGWGYRWGEEFNAEFSVKTERPELLPAGVAMYNGEGGAPARTPVSGDIVLLFLTPEGEPDLRSAISAAKSGALLLAESHPLMETRFGDGAVRFTSPATLVENIFRYLENPEDLRSIAGRGSLRAAALEHPPVSIILFAYNGARYLAEAIGSALGQDYDNYEVIVIDDGSTDETEEIVKSISSPRLRYVRQAHGGAPSARNRGIAEAKGDFIVWLGSDDVLQKDCLSSHIRMLGSHPSADVIYGNIMLCDARLGERQLLRYEEWFRRNRYLPAAMIRSNVIPDGGTLIRKECYDRIGGYNTQFSRAHDYEWWSRLTGKALFKYNDSTVYRWRWHGGNLGAGSGRKVDLSFEARIVEGLLRAHPLEELFPGLGWKKGKRARTEALAQMKVAEILAGYGDTGGAIAHLEKGEKSFPLSGIRLAIQTLQRTGNREKPSMNDTKSTDPARAGGRGENDRLSVTYLITSILGVTGGNMTLLRQANALADRGHRVTIVTRTPRPAWFDIRAQVIQVGEKDPLWRSVPHSDVVISTHFMNTAELASCRAQVKIYFAQGDQFIFDDVCASSRPDVRNLHAMMKEMSRISYLLPGVRFVANSHALGSRVEELYGRQADAYLPVCVDLNVFTPLKKAPPGGVPRILIVGPDETGSDIEPLAFKGMADARRALEILKEGGENFTAVRISNTPPSVFKGFPCEFHAAPSDEGKRTLFGTADILIYASHYDSCPRPPLEAMAAGVAVVCTSTAGAREYCRDGENALLVPPRSPENIALAVRRLIHDAGLRARIALSGRGTACRFPQEREWNELERLLLTFAGRELPALAGVDPLIPDGQDSVVSHMQNAERLMKDQNVEGALASAILAEKSAGQSEAAPSMLCGVENFIGYCHLGLGDLESAKEAFSKALEADNSSSRACAGLGDVFRLAGFADQAKTMYEWALKNDPSCDAGIRGLSTVNRTLGLDPSHTSLEAGPVPDVVEDITAVKTDSAFAREVRSLFARVRPVKILETGTFIGNGTTTVIASAIRDLGIGGAKFYSVEVNPGLHTLARRNLEKAGLTSYVNLLNGLSVPRALLPGREDIEKRTVTEIGSEGVYVDHSPEERVEKYYRETDFPGVADDLIGRVLGVFEFRPDFVLLDSGGHMGNIEFNYLLSRLKGECYIALDDIFHIKHHGSFTRMQSDPRFEIVAAVREKAGFCIAHFTPAPVDEISDVAGRLSQAGEQFRRKEFSGALETLETVDRIVTAIPASAPRTEAVAGIETVRGMSYLGLSDLEKAKESFEKALRIQPRSSQACAGLGEVFYLAGLDREAKVMFEHAVALGSENQFGRAGLAKSNEALGLPVGHNSLEEKEP